MKQFSRYLVLLALMLLAIPVFAQEDPNLITLSDATPAIDVVITLPPDTTGALALDLADAAVMLRDAEGNIVFRSTDPRVHALELNILPNSGSHTLIVERIPGAVQAFVAVRALSEMTMVGSTEIVPGTLLGLNQEAIVNLDASHPGETVTVTIPAETRGLLTAAYYGTAATTQLVDQNGVVIAESTAGHVDGLNFVLADGNYQFTMLASNLTAPITAGVRAQAASDGGFINLAAQEASAQVASVNETSAATCTAVIAMSSVNLRSGPGTGYSVIGYAYRAQEYVVGGRNNENSWVVIGTPDGQSAWVSSSVAQFEGSCAGLAVFNVPTRDAQPPQVVVSTPQPNIVYVPAPSTNNTAPGTTSTYHDDDDDHDDDHDDHDDDHDDD